MSAPRPSHVYRLLPLSHPTSSSPTPPTFQPLVPGLTTKVIASLTITLLLSILLLASSAARGLLSPIFPDEVVFYGAAFVLLAAMAAICVGATVLQGRLEEEDEQRKRDEEYRRGRLVGGEGATRRIVDDD